MGSAKVLRVDPTHLVLVSGYWQASATKKISASSMTLLLLSFPGNIVIDAGGHVRGGSADGRGQAEGDGADRAPEEAA